MDIVDDFFPKSAQKPKSSKNYSRRSLFSSVAIRKCTKSGLDDIAKQKGLSISSVIELLLSNYKKNV